MASILRVNTLTDASSNNSTPMATVNQGTAKAWVNFTGQTNTAERDSFNISSLTDAATAKTYPIAFTSNMGNINYTGSYFQSGSVTGTDYDHFNNNYVGGFGSRATNSFGVHSYGASNAIDVARNDTVIFGDSA